MGTRPYLETQYKVFSWSSGIPLDPIALTSFPVVSRFGQRCTLVQAPGFAGHTSRTQTATILPSDRHRCALKCRLTSHALAGLRQQHMRSIKPLGSPGAPSFCGSNMCGAGLAMRLGEWWMCTPSLRWWTAREPAIFVERSDAERTRRPGTA